MRGTITVRSLDLEATGIAIDFTDTGQDLVKIAFFALSGFFLVFKGKFCLFEFLEKFFPSNFYQ